MKLLGIDLGSTGCKAILLSEDGRLLSTGYQGYNTQRMDNGRVEQNPVDWWDSLVSAVRQVCSSHSKHEEVAISLSTQGASSLVMSVSGEVLYPAITWMDTRAEQEKMQLLEELDDDYFYQTTGWGLNPILDACKARWLINQQPQLLDGNLFLSSIEYLNYRLTDTISIDPSNAGMRQMMNIQKKQWDEKILSATKMNIHCLPQILETGTFIGYLTKEAADVLNLSKKSKVYQGAHDQYCAGLGSGSIAEGDIFLGTGTAWALMANSKRPIFTPSKISPGSHIIEGLWGALCTVPCAGMALDWLDTQVLHSDYEQINQSIMNRLGQNKELLFFPYFTGRYAPDWQSNARGSVMGLELKHDGMDMALALMEGVAFSTNRLIQEYKAEGIDAKRLRVMGGAGKSKPWMQVLSAITQCQIDLLPIVDASAMGAAMIAGIGSSVFKNAEEAVAILPKENKLDMPSKSLIDFYQNKNFSYEKTWSDLSKIYERGAS